MFSERIEQSTISRSTSSTDITNIGNFNANTGSLLDSIFPILNQTFQHTKLPKFFYMLLGVIVLVQTMAMSLWPNNSFYNTQNSFIKYIWRIVFFIDIYGKWTDILVTFIIIVVVFTISILFLAFEIFYYKKNLRFLNWTLTVTSFVFEILCPIFIFPSAALICISFKLLTVTGKSVYWVILFITFFLYVVLLVSFYYLTSFRSYSAFLRVTTFSSTSNYLLPMIICSNSLLFILSSMFVVLEDWATAIFQLLNIVTSIYFIYKLCFLPFHKFSTNISIMAIHTSYIVMDISLLIFHFFSVPVWVPLVESISTFIVFCIIFSIIHKQRIKKIKKKLNRPRSEEAPVDDDKSVLFHELGIDRSQQRALLWIYQGMANACDYFIDFSIVKYSFNTFDNAEFKSRIAQILAYFPTETRQLGRIIAQLGRRRDLSLPQKFLCYEIYRVKVNRQSSFSPEATDKMIKLKSQTTECLNNLLSFWSKASVSISFAEKYAEQTSRLNSIWQETLRDYPNNSKIASEYSYFLAECCTDFEASIMQANRSTMIESGHNFSIDIAFRCFVQAYPIYLKNRILSFRGQIIKQEESRKGSTSKQSTSDSADDSSLLEIEAEVEDGLAKKMFDQGHLRLSLHNAIKDRKTCASEYMVLISAITSLITICLFIVVYFVVSDTFQTRRSSMKKLKTIVKIKFYIDMSQITTFVYLLKDNYMTVFKQRTDHPNKNLMEEWSDKDKEKMELTQYIDPYGEGRNMTLNYLNTARQWFNELLGDLADLSADGKDIINLVPQMMTDVVDMYFCNFPPDLINNDIYGPIQTNIRSIMSSIIQNSLFLTGRELKKSLVSEQFCENHINHDTFMTESSNIFDAFYDEQEREGKELQKVYMLIMIILGAANFFVLLLPPVISIIKYILDVKHAIKALLAVNQKDKDESMKNIMTDVADGGKIPAEMVTGHSKLGPAIVVVIILSLMITLWGVLTVYTAWENCDRTNTMNAWLLFAGWRLSGCTGTVYKVVESIEYYEGSTLFSTFAVPEKIKKLAVEQIKLMENANNYLMMGNDELGIESVYGFDSLLDDYNVKEYCEKDRADGSMHGTYMCASATQQISSFKSIVLDILGSKKSGYILGAEENQLHLIHIASSHIWKLMGMCVDRLVTLCEVEYETMLTQMVTIAAVGILFTIISFIYILLLERDMRKTYGTIQTLLKRLPPTAILSNKLLMEYIMKKSKKDDDNSMGSYQSVIHHSINGIVCTNLNGTIEINNPAASSILSCTPEQMLGQPVHSFFNQESGEILEKQMTLMRNGEAGTTYEDHLVLENGVNAAVVVLGMQNEHESRISSFVLIFQDESDSVNQQMEAEKAKARSETLLYQILPRDIVVRLNQGEKDICFTVESATIIFIDIVKFSEYASNLSPQEIMGNLSLVFAAFDENIKKYPLLIKIKLIGDVYMAAAGLFAHDDDDPKEHAIQTVQFALDCLTALDEINVRLNANLAVRIGINSGGPLLAGVLGTDKPVFDIIGDPINIAARLQSTDMPGLIQVSSGTKSLIESCNNFQISERGEVFLKGKGNQMTYFVSPVSDFMASLSNSDMLKSAGSINNR